MKIPKILKQTHRFLSFSDILIHANIFNSCSLPKTVEALPNRYPIQTFESFLVVLLRKEIKEGVAKVAAIFTT